MMASEFSRTVHPPAAEYYVTGGALRRDAPSYVRRRADDHLYEGLLAGQFCYVLTARQMGKSSLMVRTVDRLRARGIAVAVLDLTAVGQNLHAEQWYNSLLWLLGKQLGVTPELDGFMDGHRDLAPLHRLVRALREVVLEHCRSHVVIFIDEIDAVRSLPFSTDEFFAAIRELYNRRTLDPELMRLSFCLLGVAAPSDLIRDTRSTPFNIGRRIELHDFTTVEAAPLARGLGRDDELSSTLLRRMLYWTGGHPYLTQRLCKAVADDASVRGPAGVDRLCADLFFAHGAEERDNNLLFVRERMLRSEVDLHDLLGLYEQILRRKRAADDETNPLVVILRLSGVTRSVGGDLVVRNRIYARVFDRRWVEAHTDEAEVRRQRAAYRRGLRRAAAVAALVLLIVSALGLVAVQGWRQAITQRQIAEQQERRNRVLLYAAQMNLAQQAWEGGNVRRVVELLEAGRPQPGEGDLRSFEWYRLWRLSHSEMAALRFESETASVAFSPDGGLLAIGCGDHTVRLWDVRAGKEMAVLRDHTGAITTVAFSPDGRWLASGSRDRTARIWDVASTRGRLTLTGHQNDVTCLAFSPDGETLVTGSSDGSARLWKVDGGEGLGLLRGHTGSIYAVAFSPDGQTVAVRSDFALTFWNAFGAKGSATVEAHKTDGTDAALAFSPDGGFLAESTHDEVRLWDVATRRAIGSLRGHVGDITATGFAQDGALATGGMDGAVKLWEPQSGQLLSTFKGHTDAIRSIAFAPDGKTLATAGGDRTVKIWNRALRQEEPVTLRGHSSYIHFTAFSPDGRWLATGGNDMLVKIWDTANGREIRTLKEPVDASASGAFSPDGRWLATGGHDTRVRLWDVASGKELKTFDGHTHAVVAVAFSADGNLLATGGNDCAIKLWDIAGGREVSAMTGLPRPAIALAFAADGASLTSFDGRNVRVWDLANAREGDGPCACRGLAQSQWINSNLAFGHTFSIGVADFNPDRYHVFIPGPLAAPPGGRTGVPRTRGWHKFELVFEDGGCRMSIDGHQVAYIPGDFHFDEVNLHLGGPVWRPDAAFYFDDACITRPGADQGFCDDVEDVRLNPFWYVRERYGAMELSTEQRHSGIQSMKLASMGGGQRDIIVGHRFDTATKGAISAWLYDTAPDRQTLYATLGAINNGAQNYAAAAVSPDGSKLATVVRGESGIKVWDLRTRQELATLIGHAGPVYAIAFSPDGRRIATGSADRTVKLWDLETHQEVATLKGHTDTVTFLLFSPDGSILAAGSTDSVVKLWHGGSLDKPF
jgi:WD40 repeat protein